jgi:hypothetical protein
LCKKSPLFNSTALDINSSIKAYLFAGVKNRALDYLKHAKVKSSYAGTFDAKTALVQPKDTWEFSESELLDLMEKGLQQLTPPTREIFEMSRYKGLSNDQIALQQINQRINEKTSQRWWLPWQRVAAIWVAPLLIPGRWKSTGNYSLM